MDRITVISGPERRRAWTAEQKEALVLAACSYPSGGARLVVR